MRTRAEVEDLIMRLRERAVEPGVQMRWRDDFNAAADALDELAKDRKWPPVAPVIEPKPPVPMMPKALVAEEPKPAEGEKTKETG